MLPILGVIITVILHLSCARNDSLSKNYKFPNQHLILADPSFNNKTLFYALHTKSSRECTVVQEISPFTNYSVTKQCKFAVKADTVQLVFGFGTEKAVLITQEDTSKSLKLKTTTVHMDGCKIVSAELVEVPTSWTNRKLYRDYIDVVVSPNGFEVIIKGLSHLCTKPDIKVYCGISYDTEGNKIEGPLIWPKMAYEKIDIISPILTDVSGQGYFFVNRDESSLMAFQFNRKGGPKFVKLWYTPTQHTSNWREGYSVSNEVHGMCYNVDSTVSCWQTDRQGEIKISTEFEFDPAFKAIIKQCNTTQPPYKIPESTTPVTKIEDSTTQGTTTQSTTVQLTTVQETTITETTSQGTVASETNTKETVASETTVIEATTKTNQETTTTAAGTTTETTVINETITAVQENTEDDMMEPITVKGIAVEDITTQVATTQIATVEDSVTQDSSTVTENVAQENVTEISADQQNTTEIASVQNNTTQETVFEADTVRSISNTIQETVVTDDVALNNVTTENNVALESTTESNTAQDITVQGLTTIADTTRETTIQENTTTESAVSKTTPHYVSFQAFTVQGITTEGIITPRILSLKSMSQIKTTVNQKVWNLFIHNLRSGGFIMFIITCPDRICTGTDDHYYLVRINASGKQVGQLEIHTKSKCNPVNGDVYAKVIENDQGQYCAVRLCKSKLDVQAQLETLVNCYCNSDFK